MMKGMRKGLLHGGSLLQQFHPRVQQYVHSISSPPPLIPLLQPPSTDAGLGEGCQVGQDALLTPAPWGSPLKP